MTTVEELLSYRDFMVGVALHRLGNRESAEDVAQISAMKALASLSTLRDTSSIKAWLRVIVTNTCHNYYRAQRHYTDIETIEFPGPEPEVEYDERKELLRKEIDKLPPKQKLVMTMLVYEGKSIKEVAAAMNSPYNTVKANYRHGMITVRSRLRAEQ